MTHWTTKRRIVRATAAPLDGTFCVDSGRHLAVTFGKNDTLVFWPKGTTRRVEASAADLYRYVLRCRANAAVLERARERKAARAQRFANQRQARAEKRLVARL
jgi:hypothetical protein